MTLPHTHTHAYMHTRTQNFRLSSESTRLPNKLSNHKSSYLQRAILLYHARALHAKWFYRAGLWPLLVETALGLKHHMTTMSNGNVSITGKGSKKAQSPHNWQVKVTESLNLRMRSEGSGHRRVEEPILPQIYSQLTAVIRKDILGAP